MSFQWPATLQEFIVCLVGSLGIVWYYVCIFYVGSRPLAKDATPTSFRQFMSLSITTISVSLATFVGMLLGLRTVTEKIQEGVSQANAMGANATLPQLNEVARIANPDALQWASAILYIVSLVIALIFWWRGGEETDSAISKLGQSLLGLIAGALSILLNTK